MKKSVKSITKLIIIAVLFISLFSFINVFSADEVKTNVYFSNRLMWSSTSKKPASADAILLENIDSSGNKRYGLIDTGNQNNPDRMIDFLNTHNVKKLDFLVITHWHSDHAGNIDAILEKKDEQGNYYYEIDKIYAKEYDSAYSTNGIQAFYDYFITDVIDRKIAGENTEVIGISDVSLTSSIASPNRSEAVLNSVTKAQNNGVDLSSIFKAFDSNNISFTFGSSTIKLYNWELFDVNGNIYNTSSFASGSSSIARRKIAENDNSICLLLIQGNKKAFFTGDLNNEETTRSEQYVLSKFSEDNVGEIDLLKLGHHGYSGSSSEQFLSTLNPKLSVITSKYNGASNSVLNYLNNHNMPWVYVSSEPNELAVKVSNSSVEIIPGAETQYTAKSTTASNWNELSDIIASDQDKPCQYVNDKCIKEKLIINLTGETYDVNSSIDITPIQNIILTTKNNVRFVKNGLISDLPIFDIGGTLDIGTYNMTGTITIDGNKNSVISSKPLITVGYGKLNIYNGITLQNNINQAERSSNSNEINYIVDASGIYGYYSTINMYGGQIINNDALVTLLNRDANVSLNERITSTVEKYTLPNENSKDYNFYINGVGLSLDYSEFNMYGGRISSNNGYNNSNVESDANGVVVTNTRGRIRQYIRGGGLYANNSTQINLYDGEISNNLIQNNSILKLVTPDSSNNKYTYSNSIDRGLYASGMYISGEDVKISNLKMLNNKTIHKGIIEIQDGVGVLPDNVTSPVSPSIKSAINPGKVYLNTKDLMINGLTITNEENDTLDTQNISNLSTISINTGRYGGLIGLYSSNFIVNNMNLSGGNAQYGGAMYIDSSTGEILNSTINNNTALSRGGAIMMSNNNKVTISDSTINNNVVSGSNGYGGAIYLLHNSNLTVNNSTIKNNQVTNGSAGAIYCRSDDNSTYGIYGNNTINTNSPEQAFVTGIKNNEVYNEPVTINLINDNLINKNESYLEKDGQRIDYTLGSSITNTGQYKYNIKYTSGATETINFNIETVPEENQHTVTFNSSGGSSIKQQIIVSNNLVKKPSNPTKTGYRFKQWQLNGNKYDFNTPVTSNITLTAVWEINEFDVVFSSNDGYVYDVQKINYNNKSSQPGGIDLSSGAYVFKTGNKTFDFNTPITSNLNVIVESTPETYQVTFDLNGGIMNGTNPVTVNSGSPVLKPENTPTKAGSTFVNWYADAGLTQLYDFNAPINSPTTIYAKWIENKNNGKEIYSITGDNQTFYLGDSKNIMIICSGALERLTSIKVDNIKIDDSNYILESGSTKLTLKNAYLNTLSVGTHTVTFEYGNDSVNAKLNIEQNKDTNNPQTGYDIINHFYTLALGFILLSSGLIYIKNKRLT